VRTYLGSPLGHAGARQRPSRHNRRRLSADDFTFGRDDFRRQRSFVRARFQKIFRPVGAACIGDGATSTAHFTSMIKLREKCPSF